MSLSPLNFGKVLSILACFHASLALANNNQPGQHGDSLNRLLEIASQHPGRAIHALELTLQDYPEWHRGRLELARLYFREGQLQSAKNNVAQVLRQAELPEVVKTNTLKFYRQILTTQLRLSESTATTGVTTQKDWQFRGGLNIFYGYDSNSNSGPEDQDIGLEDRLLSIDALQSSDHYHGAQVQLSSSHQLQPDSGAAATWNNHLSLYNRQYVDNQDADIDNLSLASELKIKFSHGWLFRTGLNLSRYDYGSGTTINTASLRPTVSWRNKNHHYSAHIEYKHRNYLASTFNGKDGDIHQAGLRYNYLPRQNWSLSLSGRWMRNRSNDDRYSYAAAEGSARFYYRILPELTLWTQFRYRRSHYHAAEAPLYPDARKESYITLRLGGRYKLSTKTTLQLALSDYRNRANHKLHNYDRQQAELTLNWRF